MDFTILHCEAESAVQRQRIAARRGDASEADVAVLDLQIERQEALDSDELAYTLHVDTTHSPDLSIPFTQFLLELTIPLVMHKLLILIGFYRENGFLVLILCCREILQPACD